MTAKDFSNSLPKGEKAREVLEATASFISQVEEKKLQEPQKKKKKAELKDDGTEKLTVRLSLLLTPTQKEELHIMSLSKGESINSIMNELINNYLGKNQETIDKWKKAIDELNK